MDLKPALSIEQWIRLMGYFRDFSETQTGILKRIE